MIPIDGEWVIVTIERPWADFDLDLFRAGKWQAQEAFPNTALFWAKYGSKGLARELAANFISNRAENRDAGRFRGRMHTSLIVPWGAHGVSSTFKHINEETLSARLTEAFDLLKKQRPPAGPSIQEEIDEAAKMLKTLDRHPTDGNQ